MKETSTWFSRFLDTKQEESKTWGNGVMDKTIKGELRHGWGFYMNILSDKEKRYTHLSLDCEFPAIPLHKKVDIRFTHDINLRHTFEYIISYNPCSYYRRKSCSMCKYSYENLAYLMQKDFCIEEGYNSYKVDIENDVKFTITVYTYCYNVAIAYDLYKERVDLCFYPKGDDEYFLSIELPLDIYGSMRTIILNWELDYYGKSLDSHSVSKPEEEEE